MAFSQTRVPLHAAAAVLLALCAASAGGCLTSKIRYEEAAAPRSVAAIEDAERSRFLFYTGDQRVPGDLESVARVYGRDDGTEVSLLAMVHFADRSFYDRVAERIAAADVVLFEGSADAVIAGGAVADETATADAASIFEALDLVPQPDGERLGPAGPRYVRGDVEKDDLAARVDALRKSGATWSPAEFPRGLFTVDRVWYALTLRRAAFRRAWRHAFANRLRPVDEQAIRDVLIEPRNERLLACLDAEAARPRAPGRRLRIAVPWGSEHMAGIERGLVARGFRLSGSERVVAWRVRSYE